MAEKIRLTELQMRQGIFVIPMNHDCENSGPVDSETKQMRCIADPKQTIRVGSKHYHFCRVHGLNR